jgi:anti-sigma regulatory factor (Ser/Thr protein kinase)
VPEREGQGQPAGRGGGRRRLGTPGTKPEADPILGAALEGLRRAAEEVEVERSAAETLQRSLLRERLPEVPGLRLAARYLPGSGEARIGGDWYDAVPLRDGRLALVIGDVVGRGIGAAARMAHLQSAVRAYALEGLRPSLLLERMNGFVEELESRATATLMIALVDPESETVRIASAGHPPPLLVAPDRATMLAEGPPGPPLGAARFPHYDETVVAMPAGSTLVLYTDGLAESEARTLDEGLARMAEVAAGLAHDPDAVAGGLTAELIGESASRDDVALLVACLDAAPAALELGVPADPAALTTVRRALGRWLRAAGVEGTEAYELQVACGEACANAIAHAYAPGDAQFAVRAHAEDGMVVLEVSDFGAWQEPRGGSGGRGLALMRELTDELDIERGPGGTTVRMRKRPAGPVAA